MTTTALILPPLRPLSPLTMRQRMLSPLVMMEHRTTVVYLASLPTSVIDFILSSIAGDRLTTLSGEELAYV